jgi:hypothetical protein
MNPWLYIAKKRKEEKIKKAAAEISEYCISHPKCFGCEFYNENHYSKGWGVRICRIDDAPHSWDLGEK